MSRENTQKVRPVSLRSAIILICLLTPNYLLAADPGEFYIPEVVPLAASQRERLRELICNDKEAADCAEKVRHDAIVLFSIEPTPLEKIFYQGLLNTDARRAATVEKLRQMADVAVLVQHWQASGDPRASAALKRLIIAWSDAYRPTGNDVNENKLYPLLIAYEALRDEFSSEERVGADKWVEKLGELHHSSAIKKSDHLTNRYSKHLRLSALCGMILGREEWVQAALDGVKRFVSQSLRADGTSRDLEWRDSLGYHGSALRPAMQLALLAGEQGRELYSWESEKGGSIKKSVEYMIPYAMGEKVYREWVNTKVQFDRDRAAAGIEKYRTGKPYDPQDALKVMGLASYFDPDLMDVVLHLAKSESRRFPTWTTLVSAACSANQNPTGEQGTTKVPRSPVCLPVKKPLFVSGENGYHTYRIPSLLVTKAGTLLAFCEGRKSSWKDHGDVDLLMRRSIDGGRTWSEQQIVYEEGGSEPITIGNPCPVVDQTTGLIWLPLCRDNRDVLVTCSADDGKTWSRPRDISTQVVKENWTWVATGPGVGIQLHHGNHSGRLVIPCDHRDGQPVKDDSRNRCFSHVIYSDDHGRTWQLGGRTQAGSYECQVVQLADGRLMLNGRMQQQSQGYRGVSFSDDGGISWPKISHDDELPDPICQASLIRVGSPASMEDRSSDLLLFANPAVRKIPGIDKNKQRHNLTIKLSRDGGKTWPVERLLHPGPAAYSSLATLQDGTIGCLYEGDEHNWRNAIHFARFDLDWLDTADQSKLEYTIEIETPLNAPDQSRHWMQARAGVVPRSGKSPLVVMTMQLKENRGVHMFHGLSSMRRDGPGGSWSEPQPHQTLSRRIHGDGMIEVFVDSTPSWHASSRKLLLTGATFWLDPTKQRHAADGASDVAYSHYDAQTHSWAPWQKVKLPDEPKFHFARAGCTQRVDLPNGDLLLPIYFNEVGNDGRHRSTVLRCRFDGQTLRYVEHGTELSLDLDRGLYEPSLTYFKGRFYLTLRNDRAAYVTTSDDGLHFARPQKWRFDDGAELGSYNTQQHWITHSDGLFLAYTRRGADNDDLFRHRAPLFIARVDTETLRVVRRSEQVLLPKIQAGFGNFGICNVTQDQTWVTAGRRGAKAGQPNVYVTKIHWSKENRLVESISGTKPGRDVGFDKKFNQ